MSAHSNLENERMRRAIPPAVLPAIAALVIAAAMLPLRVEAAGQDAADTFVAGEHQQAEVDDNDDTRVEVQLVVLSIVIGTVFVAGSAIYLLRKRLGLVPTPPESGADANH
jgi:hypothetical protein